VPYLRLKFVHISNALLKIVDKGLNTIDQLRDFWREIASIRGPFHGALDHDDEYPKLIKTFVLPGPPPVYRTREFQPILVKQAALAAVIHSVLS
jgi:hypothetical protein